MNEMQKGQAAHPILDASDTRLAEMISTSERDIAACQSAIERLQAFEYWQLLRDEQRRRVNRQSVITPRIDGGSIATEADVTAELNASLSGVCTVREGGNYCGAATTRIIVSVKRDASALAGGLVSSGFCETCTYHADRFARTQPQAHAMIMQRDEFEHHRRRGLYWPSSDA